MWFFVLSQKVSKDQTRCFSATMLQTVTTQSRIDAPLVTIVSMSRTGCVFFQQLHMWPCFSHLRCLQWGNWKSCNLGKSHSENNSSNMLDEDKGCPGFWEKYAPSASNMPQITGTSFVPSFTKYIASQGRLGPWPNMHPQHIQKNLRT